MKSNVDETWYLDVDMTFPEFLRERLSNYCIHEYCYNTGDELEYYKIDATEIEEFTTFVYEVYNFWEKHHGENIDILISPCKHCEYANLIDNKCSILPCKCYENKNCINIGCSYFKLGEWNEN